MMTKFLGLPENLDGTLRKKPGPKCCSNPAVRGGQGMLKHIDPLAEDLPVKRKRTAVTGDNLIRQRSLSRSLIRQHSLSCSLIRQRSLSRSLIR